MQRGMNLPVFSQVCFLIEPRLPNG